MESLVTADAWYLKCIRRRKGQTVAKFILQKRVEEPALPAAETEDTEGMTCR